MIAALSERRFHIGFGAVFGAWLGGVYAFFSQAVNWWALPGVPLAEPEGGLGGFIFTHILLGAALGTASAIPHSTALGVVSGGVLAALLSAAVSVAAQWGDETVIRTIILLLYTFLPLAMLLMPLAYMIRRGVDAQTVDPERPYLWARRILVPALMTLVVIGLAAFSLYSKDVRRAFRYTHEMVQAGLQADSREELPASLRAVPGFMEMATPEYEMYWSDRAEEFFGPRPASGEMSQFLIFTRFRNGYRIACVFSATTSVPNCTNQ